MKVVNIKVREVALDKIDLRKNVMDVSLSYLENSVQKSLKQSYSLNEDTLKLVEKIFSSIRALVKDEHAVVVDADDFLAYYVNIIFKQGDKEKVVNAINRFKDRLKTLRNVAMHGSYLKHYNELIGLKSIID